MMIPMPASSRRTFALSLVALSLTACAVAPRGAAPPAIDTPAAFKQGQGDWVRAVPADALARGPWWRLFGDPALDDLAQRVERSNPGLAAAAASYAQARALTTEQRAGLFPGLSLDTSAGRSGGRGDTAERSNRQLGIGASWAPDLFGRVGSTIGASVAGEQASAADLAAVRLALQGELATQYFSLREADAERAILASTIAGFQRTLQIAQNRYEAGIVSRTDPLQAQTQLANAQAELLGVERLRARLEHAIAVLVGSAPANFSLAAQPQWRPEVPEVPVDVPSTLLQRRPDIAAAERRVAQANQQVGIAQSGYYPSLRLSGAAGLGAGSASDLFSASALVWSLGASLAQTLFDAGATDARVERSRAALDQAGANYRAVVLRAFREVEDQLVAARVLAQQQQLRQQASQAADRVEQQVLNRYQAGQVGFTEVAAAQASAGNARRALLQVQADRQTAAVALIQALGGGWGGL